MDFSNGPEVSAEAARVIVDAMKVVACADGDLHQRELEIINQFEAGIPADASGTPDALSSPELKETLITSLVMVALADGKLSDEEMQVIRNLAADHGVSNEQVDVHVESVKKAFLQQFDGVKIFRESVRQVADDLGVDID